MPVQEMFVGTPMPPDSGIQVAQAQQPSTLYITLGPDGVVKVGTCSHCVIEERGRPEHAWDADEDNELDFDRDTLFAYLAELGIVLINRQAYVCP
jgi:hypothetical protein